MSSSRLLLLGPGCAWAPFGPAALLSPVARDATAAAMAAVVLAVAGRRWCWRSLPANFTSAKSFSRYDIGHRFSFLFPESSYFLHPMSARKPGAAGAAARPGPGPPGSHSEWGKLKRSFHRQVCKPHAVMVIRCAAAQLRCARDVRTVCAPEWRELHSSRPAVVMVMTNAKPIGWFA